MENGQQLGKYRIERPIGQGGMASVYLATDTTLNRPVALKVLDPLLAEDTVAVERFKREAQTAAQLQHPNIVSIYDVAQIGENYYIAMRYAPGKTLRDIITDEAPMAVGRVVQLLRPVAAALDYAHTRGVVHRDVKPGNIIVNPRSGEVMLTDFGIARAQDQSHLTVVGMVMGTADYLSPEQVRGEEASASSDIYALGVVMYEMLTGYTPYHNKGIADVLRAQLNEPVPPLSRFVKNPPLGTQAIIDRSLAKSTADRFQTASGMIEGLAMIAIRAGQQGKDTPPPQAPTQRAPAPPRQQQPVNRNPPPVAQPTAAPRPAQRPANLSVAPPARQPQRYNTPQQSPLERNKAANEAALEKYAPSPRWPLLLLGLLLLTLIGLAIYFFTNNGGTLAGPAATPTVGLEPTAAFNGQLRSPGSNGPNLSATFLEQPPTLDGDLSEWRGRVPAFEINKDTPFRNGSPYKWRGPDDSSGSGFAAWDATNFYFAVDVSDDKLVQPSTGQRLYEGDHIELWFDLDLQGDFASDKANDDDYQLGFSIGDPAKPQPEAWLWLPTNRADQRSTFDFFARSRNNGYIIEGAIPWATLRDYKPERGQVIGFAFNIGDVDEDGAPHQEKMISTSPLMTYPNPTTFGNMFLRLPSPRSLSQCRVLGERLAL